MELCLNFPQHWPRSLCQKCRLQVTAKYAYTLRMWLCMKWYGAWLYSVHRFVWHQPCQRCKYTTSVDIQKRAIKKKLFIHVESHASAVSLLNSGEQRYIKAISSSSSKFHGTHMYICTTFALYCINACPAPNLEMSPKRFTMATVSYYYRNNFA